MWGSRFARTSVCLSVCLSVSLSESKMIQNVVDGCQWSYVDLWSSTGLALIIFSEFFDILKPVISPGLFEVLVLLQKVLDE